MTAVDDDSARPGVSALPITEIGPEPPRGSGPTALEAEPSEGMSQPPLIELNALLGRGTRYVGNLHFEGRVRIEGRFEGEIRGDDVLVIGTGGDVEGDIEVGVCIVTGGKVNANIRARQAIELHAPSVVNGDLHAPNVFIDRGVQFQGNCKMAPLDDTRGAADAIAEAEAKKAMSPDPIELDAEPREAPEAVRTSPGLGGPADVDHRFDDGFDREPGGDSSQEPG
ncbi:MAG: polymer-forming cytoskeletal protein [Myxococcales bacterium]|nr:polymer-forming cytoskeletal protein [Myxococcales bacterium]